ncbi:MAG: hypothetical protein CYG59_00660, partial [Chloroflexi bacterium]
MGMETRRNRRYYYCKERQGTRVISTYLGTGATADLIAQCAAQRIADARHARAAWKREQQRITDQAALVLSVEADVRTLVHAVLLTNGFHQHKRQWRKRMEQDIVPCAAPAVPAAPQADDGWLALQAALNLKPTPTRKGGKVSKADVAAVEQQRVLAVRQVLLDYPHLWSRARHVISHAEKTLIARVTPQEGLPREFLETALKGIRRDLGYETAPPLEQLLIEQIAVAWLDWDLVQQMYTNNAVSSHT